MYSITLKDLFVNVLAKNTFKYGIIEIFRILVCNIRAYRTCQPLTSKASMLPLITQEVEKQHLPEFIVKRSFFLFNVSEEFWIYGLLFNLEFTWKSITTYSSWSLFWGEYAMQLWYLYAWHDNFFIHDNLFQDVIIFLCNLYTLKSICSSSLVIIQTSISFMNDIRCDCYILSIYLDVEFLFGASKTDVSIVLISADVIEVLI